MTKNFIYLTVNGAIDKLKEVNTKEMKYADASKIYEAMGMLDYILKEKRKKGKNI